MKKALAASFGLTLVDPDSYGGWDGDCPGADLDARFAAMRFRLAGHRTTFGLNSTCTYDRAEQVFAKVLRTASLESTACLFFSGHGGQVPGISRDEKDRKDETLCLWDGELIDDTIGLWLATYTPPGGRVFFVSDCCNAGTNFRARRIALRPKPFTLSKTLGVRGFKGQLIHWGGCRDGASSYGGPDGGTFTLAWGRAASGRSYRNTFDDIYRRMPRNQKPVWHEFGFVTDKFRNAVVCE